MAYKELDFHLYDLQHFTDCGPKEPPKNLSPMEGENWPLVIDEQLEFKK